MSQQQLSSNEDLRLFIGCSVDENWKDAVLPVTKKLKAQMNDREVQLSWTVPENYHLTLIFLGSVPSRQLESLQTQLTQQATRQAPFSLRSKGLGAFPDEQSARVLFAGVARSQPLLDLQSALEESLMTAGFPVREEREYVPHITLAQLRNPKSIRSMIDPWVRKDFGKLSVQKIILFKSIQVGPFRKYKPLSEHELQAQVRHEIT